MKNTPSLLIVAGRLLGGCVALFTGLLLLVTTAGEALLGGTSIGPKSPHFFLIPLALLSAEILMYVFLRRILLGSLSAIWLYFAASAVIGGERFSDSANEASTYLVLAAFAAAGAVAEHRFLRSRNGKKAADRDC